MNFSFDGKTNRNIMIEDKFQFPIMTKYVEYNSSSHSNYRRRLRSIREPFSFSVPFLIRNNQNKISRDDLIKEVTDLLYSDEPKKFKVNGTDWYFIGEFNGPFLSPLYINAFTVIDVNFTSSYSHKFYDDEYQFQISSGQTHSVDSRTEVPSPPIIRLTGLTGNDVQISLVDNDDIRRIRLSGNLPSNLTIDVENERIYETSSGVNRINLLRITSDFENFKISNGDSININNGSASVEFKELLL